MASELRVNTLKDAAGANSVAMTYVAGGSSKFWVSFDGVTPSTSDSLNQSTLTDNGTGDFTHTFTSAFGAATYGFQLSIRDGSTAGRGRFCTPQNGSTYSTTAFQSEFQNDTSSTMQDPDDGSVWAVGDLA